MPRAARFDVELLGLASDQAAIDLWRADRMPLPAALLTDGARIAKLREVLLLAEELGKNIDRVVLEALTKNALAPSRMEDQKDHKGFKDEMRKLKQALGAMPAYWAALGQAFAPCLDALGGADDLDAMLADWKHTLRTTARDVVRDAEFRLGLGTRALQAGAKARHELRRVLCNVLGNEPGTVMPAVLPTTTTSMEGVSA